MTQKKNKKLLSTSINKRTSSLMDEFNSSIDIDQRLIEEDILVTQAHVSALVNLKIISKIEEKKIYQGLNEILNDYQKGKIKNQMHSVTCVRPITQVQQYGPVCVS